MTQVIYYDADGVKIFYPATRHINLALEALDLARRLGHSNARLRTVQSTTNTIEAQWCRPFQ